MKYTALDLKRIGSKRFMELVKDIESLEHALKAIKQKNVAYLNNFVLSPEKIKLYIQEKLVFIDRFPNSLFLFIKMHDYYKLYYFTQDYKDMVADFNTLNYSFIIICELLNYGDIDKDAQEMLENCGFTYYSSLINMYKTMQASTKVVKLPNNVVYAEKEDVDEIWQLLLDNFNKYVDINIIKKELENYIKDKHVIITKEHGKIVAFCVYFVTKGKGEGRYLYIDKDYKDTLLGVMFMSIMLELLNGAKYLSGFVREDNKYLFSFYEKLNFQYGDLKNIIYCKVPVGQVIDEIKPMN